MFERFTDRARRVVVQAREESRRLDHDYIGTEHILLGLVHEGVGGLAAKVLESLGIGQETVRQRVEETVARGQQAPSGHVPFTAEAKQSLELALRESASLATTTSAPSTSCSASSVRLTAWRPTCSQSWAPTWTGRVST